MRTDFNALFAPTDTKETIMKIKDSVAFVTGGNRGLGRAMVHELLERGAAKVYATCATRPQRQSASSRSCSTSPTTSPVAAAAAAAAT